MRSVATAQKVFSAELVVPMVVVLFCTLALYLPTLWLDFLSDDFKRIEDALSMARLGPEAFLLEAGSDGYYRPIFYITLALDARLWGLKPIGFHLTNLLVHLVVLCLAIQLIAHYLLPNGDNAVRRYLLLMIAAALALYPHHMDAVAWISARSDLLSSLFCLGSLAIFLAPAKGFFRRWGILIGPILLGLGILSKETAFSFILILIAAWVTMLRPRSLGRLIPYLVVPLFLGIWRLVAFGEMGVGRIIPRFLAWVYNATISLSWLFIPADGEWLQFFSQLPFFKHPGIRAAIAVGMAGFVLLLFRTRKSQPAISRGLAFACITLLLSILAGVRARYLYLPSFGAVPACLTFVFMPLCTWWVSDRHKRESADFNRVNYKKRRGKLRILGLAIIAFLSLVVISGYLIGVLQRRAAWEEASQLSNRFLINLADAAQREPQRSIYVIGAPFTVRGASVAANWTAALRLTQNIEADIYVINTLRVPKADWEGPDIEKLGPGEFLLHLEPDIHKAFHYPGDVLKRSNRVKFQRALVTVIQRDALGRAVNIHISLTPDQLTKRPLILIYKAGQWQRI